jgi:autotransporter translocation and assembly factor TamB
MGQSGKSAISLNYDLGRHITAKTHVDSEGTTGLGIFLTRDY